MMWWGCQSNEDAFQGFLLTQSTAGWPGLIFCHLPAAVVSGQSLFLVEHGQNPFCGVLMLHIGLGSVAWTQEGLGSSLSVAPTVGVFSMQNNLHLNAGLALRIQHDCYSIKVLLSVKVLALLSILVTNPCRCSFLEEMLPLTKSNIVQKTD